MSLLTFSIAIWYIVIYLDFGWLILGQIQMYPDWDTILQLLPAHRIQQHDFAKWLLKGKSKDITKHLMYGPSGN